MDVPDTFCLCSSFHSLQSFVPLGHNRRYLIIYGDITVDIYGKGNTYHYRVTGTGNICQEHSWNKLLSLFAIMETPLHKPTTQSNYYHISIHHRSSLSLLCIYLFTVIMHWYIIVMSFHFFRLSLLIFGCLVTLHVPDTTTDHTCIIINKISNKTLWWLVF